MQAESVGEADSSPAADSVVVKPSVDVESSNQQSNTRDSDVLDVSVSPTVVSHTGGAMVAASSVVTSMAHITDTGVTTSVSGTATALVVKPVHCTTVDSTLSVSASATHSSAAPSIVKPVQCTAVGAAAAAREKTSDAVIDIADDDDDVIVTETAGNANARVRDTVADTRRHRKTDAAEKSQSPVSESSPVAVSYSRLAEVITSSNGAASLANQKPAQTTPTATDRPPGPRVIGQAVRSTAAQLDPPLPTARVIGRIVSIRGPSPRTRQTTAHGTLTTVTQSTSAVTTLTSASTSNAATVTPAAKLPAASVTVNAQTSASNRSMARRAGVRRAPRRRRVAVLRPEELYEISSQIVAEVLQRNRHQQQQPGQADSDVINCDEDVNDDDDDDVAVVAVDVSDGRSGSSSCDDVMIVDEPAAPQCGADNSAEHSGAKHFRAEFSGTETSGAERCGAQHSRAKHFRAERTGTETSGTMHFSAERTGTGVSAAERSRPQHSGTKQFIAEHTGTETSGTEHSRAQHSGAKRSGTEICGAERPRAQRCGAKQFRAERTGTKTSGMELPRAQHSGAKHFRAEHNRTEISGMEHHSTVPPSAAQHSRPERSALEHSRAEPSGAALCSTSGATPLPRKRLIIPSSSHQLVNTTDCITVVDAEGSDDPEVICCDDNPLRAAERSSVRPGPTVGFSAATAAAATDNDEVLICDTPGPSDPSPAASEHVKTQSSSTVGHCSSRRTTMASPQTSTSVNLSSDSVAGVTATLPSRGLRDDDDIVVLDLDADTSSASDSQGNTDVVSSGGSSSVIVLD